mmetsp:Transcript_6991/g.10184  ORF Transcript_6991/g.10184 Transcript_6991/m.10184 type:complete len:226 (+) Transcript_6991:117-794(+)
MAKKNSTTKNSNNAKKSVAANKRHGAHKICAHPSCSKQAFKGYEVCMRHGAKGKKCSEAGCLNMAINESVCIRHGAVSRKGKCAQEGCTNLEYLNGVCQRHGAKVYYCTQNDCSNKAIIGGVCRRHGAKAYICREKGCTSNVKNSGVCLRHGAARKTCCQDGCNSPANRGRVCYKHRHFQKIQSKNKEASSMPRNHRVQQKFNVPNSFVIIVGSSRMKRSLFESS